MPKKKRVQTLIGTTELVTFKVTPEDMEMLMAAAKRVSLNLGSWARMRAIEAARREVGDAAGSRGDE